MPIYEYMCPQGHESESLERIGTDTVRCPVCGEKAARQMSVPGGFDFRGPGFYATDYAPKRQKESATKEGGSGGESPSGDSGDSGGSGGSGESGKSGESGASGASGGSGTGNPSSSGTD